MFTYKDLSALLSTGHELGCHTYDHLDSWKAQPDVFEESIRKNIGFMRTLCPGRHTWTFAYPRSEPHPRIKAIAAKYFIACRAGGQRTNGRKLDMNLIRSYFIDQRNSRNLESLIELIKKNAKEKRWLVFSTHDIGSSVSPYGCPKEIFEEVVASSVESGSIVLPIIEVCSLIRNSTKPEILQPNC
jgi:peptidoglycan/xylan/chitin deacetylase (PgdA/CDA1 family)